MNTGTVLAALGRWIGIVLCVVAAPVQAQEPSMPPAGGASGAAALSRQDAPSAAKDYYYHGALRFGGNGGFQFNNGAGTVYQYWDRLDNDSPTWTSGTIRISLFVTQTPLVPGQGFSYWLITDHQLSPLPPNNYYTNYSATRSFTSPPDGIYYIYLGVFEYENNCGSTSGFCLDDYYAFDGRAQVSGGGFYSYDEPVVTTPAVEYFHTVFGHYFVTADPDEITGLDGGAYGGVFVRTGQTWKVYLSGSGLYDVCRFFTTPGTFGDKSSHFYTANAAECAGLKFNPNWMYEKIAAKVALPVGGVCPSGTIMLYRLYNNGQTGAPNHRYTTSTTIRSQMIGQGFAPEDDNNTCVPL